MGSNANTVPSQTFYGVAIAWGLGATDYMVSGSYLGLGQSADTELGYDNATSRDQRGKVVQTTFYNPNDKGTFEYIVAVSSSYDSGTAPATYPPEGTMITVVGGDAADPISGSNWLVDSVSIRKANTDAVKVSLKLTRYGGISQ